jgi:hypothetical protein
MFHRLAAVLNDYSIEEWRSLAGYKSDSAPARARETHPPLLSELPLSVLPFERFEEFCRDLIAARHAGAVVNRFGGPGDFQSGIDIEAVFPGGQRFVYQCRRHKTFGPQKVRSTVKALEMKADRAYILLSRPATAAARTAIKPYRTWQLLDSEDISRVVRFELRPDKRYTLVDTYFPGLRQSFLGIAEPSPFLSAEQYFAPFLKRSIFSHAWTLVGRSEVAEELSKKLHDPRSVAILSGSGGLGKSRLLRELSDRFQRVNADVAVRLVDPSASVTPKDFEVLRGQANLVVIDDAHDRTDVGIIAGLVARSVDPVRLLIVTRPHALSYIQAELSRAGLFLEQNSVCALKHLRKEEVEELASQILRAFDVPVAAAADIARVTADSPLATVVGSYLVATRRIQPSVLVNEEEFRQQLYRSFEDAITGELGKTEQPATVREVLGLIALVQPVDPDDPQFRTLAPGITGRPVDEVLRVLNRLYEGGILLKRGRNLRIVPDLLGEYILEDRCVSGTTKSSSGFAERVAAQSGSQLLRHLIVNFSRLDWRLSRAATPADNIAKPLWDSLMHSYAEDLTARSAITKATSEAAYYLPARAIEFADLAIRQAGDDIEEIPNLLKRVAYNYEFIEPVCERLWNMGRNDARPLNQHPEHPIRILCELAAVEPEKPIEFCEAVVHFAIRELSKPNRDEHAHSLFDVLESGLKTEGHTTQSRGYAITFTTYVVRFEAVKALRQKIIHSLIAFVREGNSPRAVRAARALKDALRYPVRAGGSDETTRDVWTPEFVNTLGEIKKLLAADLDPVVTIELQRAISWHARFGADATKSPANEVNQAVPTTILHRLTLNLLDGWGHLRERTDDFDASRAALESEMRTTARELIATYPKSDQLRSALEERFEVIRKLRVLDESAANTFISILADECEDLCQAIWSKAISERSNYVLVTTLDAVLGRLIDRSPDKALAVARQALNEGRYDLSRPVAFAYGWHCARSRPPAVDELDLLAELCVHEDPVTATGVVRALERVAASHPKRALEMFLSLDFGKHNRLAHEAFMVFLHEKNLRVDSLDGQTFKKVVDKLLPVEEIDDHWVTTFIGKASAKFPDELLEFLLRRIEVEQGRKDEQLFGYDAIPWFWDAKLAYRDQPDFSRYVGRLVRWLKEKDDWIAQERAAVLFSSMCRAYDALAINTLSSFLFSADPSEVLAAAVLLRKAGRAFIFSHAGLVIQLLQHADSLGKETLEAVSGDLWSAAISGVRHGRPGEPFPEDLEMLEGANKELAMLPKGSVAWHFFSGIKRHAESEVKRAYRDRPEFEDVDE